MDNHFVPPPPVDPQVQEDVLDSVKKMTELDWFLLDYRSKHDPRLIKYRRNLVRREKEMKRQNRASWWRDNWIAFLGLIFSVIAALPVILQGIATILQWLE